MRRSRLEQRQAALGDGSGPLPRHEPWLCGCPEGEPLGRDPHEPMNPGPQNQSVRKSNPGFVVKCGGCGMARPDTA